MARVPLLLCICLVSTLRVLCAGNWPQWRGPAGDGRSEEQHLPLFWSHTENIAWKVPMPDLSPSTPIVWGERVFLSVPHQNAISLWCLDRSTGAKKWDRWLCDGHPFRNRLNICSPSPVTDGEHVWVLTGTGILRAFGADGTEMWSRDLPRDYGEFGIEHGYASSPLLHLGVLYVQVLHGMKTDRPSYVLAIDGLSGETIWRVERPTDASRKSRDAYTTPALLERTEGVQIVVSGGDYVTGYDSGSGTEMWRVGGLNPTRSTRNRIVASPLVAHHMIFVPSRVTPLLALESHGPGQVDLRWSIERGPDVPSPVYDGQRLYVVRDKGNISAFDGHSGQLLWGPKRLRPGAYRSSPVLGAGRIYVTSEDGVTSVLAASSEFKRLAENEVQGVTLSSPAVSQGQMLLRTGEYLYCVGTRRDGSE